MSELITDLTQERNSLNAKIEKLTHNLTKKTLSFNPKQKTLLNKQLEIMIAYSDILKDRIKDLKINKQ